MRKLLIIAVLIFFVFTLINNDNKDEIRVRVIPNSDSKEDLLVKEDVKSMTICYLKEAYNSDYDTYLSNIRATKDLFEDLVEDKLLVDLSIQLGYHTLYNKTYNNNAVKNTNEMTLYVIIGKGKGSNWWGTVYPEFLEIESDKEFKYESLILSIFNKIKGE